MLTGCVSHPAEFTLGCLWSMINMSDEFFAMTFLLDVHQVTAALDVHVPRLHAVSRSQQIIDNASPRAIAAHERVDFADKWLAL